MVPSVSDAQAKVLLIVEGERLEQAFFTQWRACHDETNLFFFPYRTNIADLYERMAEEEFDCDIQVLLREKARSPEEKSLLSQKFAETYLIFDCELQHDDGSQLPLATRAQAMIDKLRQMAEHLNNETDPTRGKLYVNYPMMESFRDALAFDQDAYANLPLLPLEDVKAYKTLVGKRPLCRIHLNTYSREDFEGLTRMNVDRLLRLMHIRMWPTYKEFRALADQPALVALQQKFLATSQAIVLNSSLFFPIDYFGSSYFSRISPPSCGRDVNVTP